MYLFYFELNLRILRWFRDLKGDWFIIVFRVEFGKLVGRSIFVFGFYIVFVLWEVGIGLLRISDTVF